MVFLSIITILVAVVLVFFGVEKGKLGVWYLMEIAGAFCATFGLTIHKGLAPSWLYKMIGGGKGILAGCVLVAVGIFMVRFMGRRANL